MIENSGLYKLVRKHVPQNFRNNIRSTTRAMLDIYAGFRGLNPGNATPDFLMIGAQKAGTTSLFNWLVESGFVQTPLVKEVGYFVARWHLPIKYRGYFRAKHPDFLVGEATPSYLAFPEVPERVLSTLGPDCKIIAVLRDPIARAVSHYYHEQRLGFEKRDIYTAMTEEEYLIKEAFDAGTTASRREYILTHYSYAYRSSYSERLAPWIEKFGRDKLLIINSESMFADPGNAVDSVASFLGVKVSKPIDFRARNENSYVFEDSRVAAYLEERLSAEVGHFKSWNY